MFRVVQFQLLLCSFCCTIWTSGEVLAPTGLTRNDIWRHLFLTKQRKNPYEEGCCTGEDLEDVKRKWKAKKEYFLQYKKDGSHPPCIDLAMALQGFDIDNTAAYHAIEDSKALHARRWQKKIFTVLRGRLCLMYVMHLSTMTMLLLLAQMLNRDGGTGMKTMLRDINVIPNGAGQGIPYAPVLPRGVQHMRTLGRFGRFTLFSPPVSPSNDTCRGSFVLVFGFFGLGFLVCFVVFLFPVFASVMEFLKFSARIRPR